MERLATFQIGEVVGDYRITGLLGQGGMGAVYRVEHLISQRSEAMKVLLPDLESSSELAERFIHEIRLQASLSHPNIAVLHTALRVNNQLLMVMEYLEGVSLSDIIRSSSITPGQAVDIVLQMLDALGYAHDRGIVHRDVKPSNIMVGSSGRVKLMDFGIARTLMSNMHMTQTGAALGSVFYMSPEQVRAQPVDGRSDLYSLAVTLFEMVAKRRPITGENVYATMEAQVNQPAPSPALYNSQLSPELCAVILKALEKNPVNRFQSARAFSRDLHQVREHIAQGAALANLTASMAAVSPAPSVKGSTSGNFGTTALVNFDPAGLERVRAQLAVHVGPMAKVLVQRAAKRAATWHELQKILAPEIPEGQRARAILEPAPLTLRLRS